MDKIYVYIHVISYHLFKEKESEKSESEVAESCRLLPPLWTM